MRIFKFLISPWKNEFIETIAQTKKELLISSPFINVKGIKILSNAVQARHSIEVTLITNLTTKNIINEFTEPKALLELYKQFAQVKVSSLGRLHAKVYLIDDRMGIITSANLTSGGLTSNFEYGVLIKGREQSPVKNIVLKNVTIKSTKTPIEIENCEPIKFINTTINGKEF